MQLAYEKNGDVQIVAIEGQINGSNAGDLEEALLACLNKPAQKAVLDLKGVNYISSAGLRVVLLIAKKLAATGGALVLCSLQPSVFEVFEMCGFVDILTLASGRETALTAVRGA